MMGLRKYSWYHHNYVRHFTKAFTEHVANNCVPIILRLFSSSFRVFEVLDTIMNSIWLLWVVGLVMIFKPPEILGRELSRQTDDGTKLTGEEVSFKS